MEMERTTSETLQLGRLTNEIQPLFGEALADAVPDYSVVEQSARLATRMYTCGILDHMFLMTTKTGETYQWDHKKRRSWYGTEWDKEHMDTRVPISYDDRANILAGLATLAETLRYKLDDSIEEPCTRQVGQEEWCIPGDEKKEYIWVGKNGYRSVIHIPKRLYDELAEAHQHPEDVPRLMALQFEFAGILRHENGHAVYNMEHGKLDMQHCIGDNPIAEIGFDVEIYPFNGHLSRLYGKEDVDYLRLHEHNGIRSNLTGVFVLWDWPYQGVVEDYRDTPSLEALEYGHDEDIAPTRGGSQIRKEPKEIRALDVAWRVDLRFIQRFFHDGFWTHGLPMGGPER